MDHIGRRFGGLGDLKGHHTNNPGHKKFAVFLRQDSVSLLERVNGTSERFEGYLCCAAEGILDQKVSTWSKADSPLCPTPFRVG